VKVRFWGVRGSIPSPGPKTMRVGGNTTCLEILPGDGQHMIVDAGTGIRELGLDLMARGTAGKLKTNLFLSHTHWDHIHGFPFFVPAFIPGNRIALYGPVNALNESLKEIMTKQMHYSYFPVPLHHLGAKMSFDELKEGPPFDVDGVKVTAKYLNHPVTVLGYRFEYKGKVVVTEFDTEPYQNIFSKEDDQKDDFDDFLFGDDFEKEVGPPVGADEPSEQDPEGKTSAEEDYYEAEKAAKEMNQRVIELARDADLLIFDAQYTAEEYQGKVGWGHSTYDDAIRVATEANVKRLAFSHHDPTRNDDAIDEIEKYVNDQLVSMNRTDVHIFAAREGMEIDV